MVTHLSGYRIMWLFCMFDLPVHSKQQRRAATKFRQFLLDEGFEMSQFSVYIRHCVGREQMETYMRRIEGAVPVRGKVHVYWLTDKQFELSRTYRGRKREQPQGNPDQLLLF